jgi:hypothetical protein
MATDANGYSWQPVTIAAARRRAREEVRTQLEILRTRRLRGIRNELDGYVNIADVVLMLGFWP